MGRHARQQIQKTCLSHRIHLCGNTTYQIFEDIYVLYSIIIIQFVCLNHIRHKQSTKKAGKYTHPRILCFFRVFLGHLETTGNMTFDLTKNAPCFQGTAGAIPQSRPLPLWFLFVFYLCLPKWSTKWNLKYMAVSENRGTPKSSILIGCSIKIINHPFWGTTIFGNTHIRMSCEFWLLLQKCAGCKPPLPNQ